MKKLVTLLVAVLLSTSVVSIFAVDSSTFIELCETSGIAAIQSYLTTGKVDVNAVTEEGKTALMSACENTSSSSLAIVALLLQKGADVNAVDSLGQTALDYAKNNTKYGEKIATVLEKAGAVATVVKTVKNSSATASEMATAAAIKVATSEEGVSTKELAETAVQAAEQTAAANQKEEVKQEESKQEEGGFLSKIKSWFSWK